MLEETSAGFSGTFLDADDLPSGMACVRDAREAGTAPPGDLKDIGGQKRAGWASWFAPADADVYRLDDMRWLFDTDRQAAKALDQMCWSTAMTRAVRILRIGPLVARLHVTPGEGAALDKNLLSALVEAVASRGARFVNIFDPDSS